MEPQIMLKPPSEEPLFGGSPDDDDGNNLLDSQKCLPILVYFSRRNVQSIITTSRLGL